MTKTKQIACPFCKKAISREEMDLEIRTGTLTLMVVDGRLAHRVCVPEEALAGA